MKYEVFSFSYEYYIKFLETRSSKHIYCILNWDTSPQGFDFWYIYRYDVKQLDEEFYEALDDLAKDQGWPLREESPLNKKLEELVDPELRELFM